MLIRALFYAIVFKFIVYATYCLLNCNKATVFSQKANAA